MTTEKQENKKEESKEGRSRAVVSKILPDGRMVEMIYDKKQRTTRFLIWDGEKIEETRDVQLGQETLVPYSPYNELLTKDIVLFASKAHDYEGKEQLVKEVQDYLHRYVDLSPSFERLAAYYVLFTWVHDRFNELPYLRLRGDYGTGKTRFLLTLGSVCYKPMFASGASSVSPIFHMLDSIGGTLLVDESDFRFSDEKADLIKILNSGHGRGFAVWRSEATKDGREFRPRAFQVFGPKVMGMRGHFHDTALESRFITEVSGERSLRKDIPLNLPADQREEAERLRNKLLMYRFRTFQELNAKPAILDARLEPRLNQIYSPLGAVVQDEDALKDLRENARGSSAKLKAERVASIEAHILTVIRALMTGSGKRTMPMQEIKTVFLEVYGGEYGDQVSSERMGRILRHKLNLMTQKSDGISVIPVGELPKLEKLFARYGVTEEDAQALMRERAKAEGGNREDREVCEGVAREGGTGEKGVISPERDEAGVPENLPILPILPAEEEG